MAEVNVERYRPAFATRAVTLATVSTGSSRKPIKDKMKVIWKLDDKRLARWMISTRVSAPASDRASVRRGNWQQGEPSS
jgi:hypothetical protein